MRRSRSSSCSFNEMPRLTSPRRLRVAKQTETVPLPFRRAEDLKRDGQRRFVS